MVDILACRRIFGALISFHADRENSIHLLLAANAGGVEHTRTARKASSVLRQA